jgi:hypothetical protein
MTLLHEYGQAAWGRRPKALGGRVEKQTALHEAGRLEEQISVPEGSAAELDAEVRLKILQGSIAAAEEDQVEGGLGEQRELAVGHVVVEAHTSLGHRLGRAEGTTEVVHAATGQEVRMEHRRLGSLEGVRDVGSAEDIRLTLVHNRTVDPEPDRHIGLLEADQRHAAQRRAAATRIEMEHRSARHPKLRLRLGARGRKHRRQRERCNTLQHALHVPSSWNR